MPDWLESLFDLAAQFTGGRPPGGPGIAWFGIAAVGWGILAYAAAAKRRHEHSAREQLLLIAFLFGFSREVLMIVIKALGALGTLDPVAGHAIFPPAEHALQNTAMVLIAAAFMCFVTNDATLARRYFKIAVVVIAVCYLSTFWWWAGHIHAHPESKFGHTWCDWLFHIAMSLLLAYPIGYLWRHAAGWIRVAVCGALSCFWLFEFLKIPDIATHEAYVAIYSPIRHGFYLLGIPIFGYVYLRELAEEVGRTRRELDQRVRDRTRALEQAQEELIRQERLATLGQLAGGVAHEVRNPLAVIRNNVYYLEQAQEDASDDIKESIQETYRAIGDSEHIIEELLDFARDPRPNTNHFLLRDALDDGLKTANIAETIQLEQAHENADVSCWGDQSQVGRILGNLIRNAIDEMPHGGKLTLTSKMEGDRVTVTVTDTGPGIPPDKIERVFEPLHTGKTKGIGLGLAISKRYAELNHAKLTAQSELGKGASFQLVLKRHV